MKLSKRSAFLKWVSNAAMGALLGASIISAKAHPWSLVIMVVCSVIQSYQYVARETQ